MDIFGIFFFLIACVMKIPFYLPFISYWLFNFPHLPFATLYTAFYLLFFVLPFLPSLLFLSLSCLLIPPKNITFLSIISVLFSDPATSLLRAADPTTAVLYSLWRRLSSDPSFSGICSSVSTILLVSFVMLRFTCFHHLLSVILCHVTVNALAVPLGRMKGLQTRKQTKGIVSFQEREDARRLKKQQSDKPPPSSASERHGEASLGLIPSSKRVEIVSGHLGDDHSAVVSVPSQNENGEKSSAASKLDPETSLGEKDECKKNKQKQPISSKEPDVKPVDSVSSEIEEVECEEKSSNPNSEACGRFIAKGGKEEQGEIRSAASITLGEWFHMDVDNNIKAC